MTNAGHEEVGTYVGEYRGVYAYVPLTHEDRDKGVTTDVRSGEVVDMPATHPNYRQLVLNQNAGAQALQDVQRVFE